ncbi:MAG: hypothetical protein LQ339_007367 [Xanthoria mediterranea]|nr:MAG: hypothetical protein LQ339_007367 [Xanthoria mediterranea]
MAQKVNDIEDMRHRKKSVGVVELQGLNGQTRVVNLEQLTDADVKLAAQFGYQPVFKPVSSPPSQLPSPIRFALEGHHR